MDDFCQAYAYFRWADGVVDVPASGELSSLSDDGRIAFTRQQWELMDRLYRGERPVDLAPEEEVIADLIGNDRADAGISSIAWGDAVSPEHKPEFLPM